MSNLETTFAGKNMFVRTVTHYHVGKFDRLETVAGTGYLILTDCAWIANTGRLGEALNKADSLTETEPFPDGEVWINVTAIVDFCEYQHSIEVYRAPKCS